VPYSGPDERLAPPGRLLADHQDGILTITLNRPDRRNAMDVAMTLEMDALLDAVALDPLVRVVVLRGAGAGFCGGMDLPDFLDTTRHGERALRAARETANDWRARRLRQLPQPVIAMVHGFCHGGGIAAVEGCDIAFAADDADFRLTEAQSGDFGEGPVAKSVSRVMTPRAARFYALGGQSFDGREAERNGLVTRSFPPADLERETHALATEFVGKDAIALQFTKETLQHVGSMTWDGALNFNAAKFAELKALQAGRPSTRAAAVESFLAGKSKPGLGA
jgi:trans-feruloyl-CoA hydratase/vanillin synthase